MTKIFLILCFLCITYSQTVNTLTGKWKLIQYKDVITGQTENEPEEYKNSESMTFTFNDNHLQGKFTGITLHNNTKGTYSLYDNNKITVNYFSQTKISEPYWGNKFWETIIQASSFSISNDTLNIYYDKDTKAMVFIRKQ